MKSFSFQNYLSRAAWLPCFLVATCFFSFFVIPATASGDESSDMDSEQSEASGKLLRETAEAKHKLYPNYDSDEVIEADENLGQYLAHNGDLNESDALFEKAIAARKKLTFTTYNSERTAWAMCMYARNLNKSGLHDAALLQSKAALELDQSLPDCAPDQLFSMKREYAYCLDISHKTSESETLLRELIDEEKQDAVTNVDASASAPAEITAADRANAIDDLVRDIRSLAYSCEQQEKNTEALQLLQEAIKIKESNKIDDTRIENSEITRIRLKPTVMGARILRTMRGYGSLAPVLCILAGLGLMVLLAALVHRIGKKS